MRQLPPGIDLHERAASRYSCAALRTPAPLKPPLSAGLRPAAKLPRPFYARSTLAVARQLIGLHLVHEHAGVRRVGRIVETEAYLGPRDLAAHSSRGQTPRNAVMFGPAGHAYVYFIYGFWNCVNVVTREAGVPQAVLLRALEPVENLPGKTWGPGLLCRAMHIDRSLNGEDLCGSRLWIERPPGPAQRVRIARATRIGVDYSGDWAQRLWRFYDSASPFVSTASPAARRRHLRGDGAQA